MNERPRKPDDQSINMELPTNLCDQELAIDEQSQAEVYDLFATLDPRETPDPKMALATFQRKLDAQDLSRERLETPYGLVVSGTRLAQKKSKLRRNGWLMAAIAAVLVAVIFIPNASVLADQFLALFRVQQFQPVNVNPQSFSSDFTTNLQSFGNIQISYDRNVLPKNPTQAQVEQSIHFPLLLPSHLPTGVSGVAHFMLINNGQGKFVFDATKAQAYLARTGQDSIHIPAQLNGATFTVTTDPGVVINYSNSCVAIDSKSADAGSTQCTKGAQLYIAEIPSPVVQATGEASLKDLRDFLLSLPKLSPQMHDLLQHLDLQNGIVPLPIPSKAQAQQVTVHGVSGVLATYDPLKLGAVIWQTHGIIYMIATTTSNQTDLLDTANALR